MVRTIERTDEAFLAAVEALLATLRNCNFGLFLAVTIADVHEDAGHGCYSADVGLDYESQGFW